MLRGGKQTWYPRGEVERRRRRVGEMGNCNSGESKAVPTTAKLIREDGKLEEYLYPVKVWQVLERISSSSSSSSSNDHEACFICNADEIDFGNFVSAVNVEEELQPGQLYFALPLRRLRYPIQAEEVAALAVKASSALNMNNISINNTNNNKSSSRGERLSSGGGQRRREVVPMAFSGSDGRTTSTCESISKSEGVVGRKRGKSGGRGNEFLSNLSAIQE